LKTPAEGTTQVRRRKSHDRDRAGIQGNDRTYWVLGPNRRLGLIGVSSDPIELAPPQLIKGSKSIEGWAGVTPADSADALRFVELRGVGAMIESYPLEQSAEIHARTIIGKSEFHVVLTM
jgi:D-arabinose 1-dehydrogenase-like Zn-dependent alcohol dehydrogenase